MILPVTSAIAESQFGKYKLQNVALCSSSVVVYVPIWQSEFIPEFQQKTHASEPQFMNELT